MPSLIVTEHVRRLSLLDTNELLFHLTQRMEILRQAQSVTASRKSRQPLISRHMMIVLPECTVTGTQLQVQPFSWLNQITSVETLEWLQTAVRQPGLSVQCRPVRYEKRYLTLPPLVSTVERHPEGCFSEDRWRRIKGDNTSLIFLTAARDLPLGHHNDVLMLQCEPQRHRDAVFTGIGSSQSQRSMVLPRKRRCPF